jgi:hypothetical protein
LKRTIADESSFTVVIESALVNEASMKLAHSVTVTDKLDLLSIWNPLLSAVDTENPVLGTAE